MRKHFYGVTLCSLGFWETVAIATRGKVPTITTTVRKSRRRQAALIMWMAGAVVHVVRMENKLEEIK